LTGAESACIPSPQADITTPSPQADITTGRRPKEAFLDVITLHALVSPPSAPGRAGTDITLPGARDEDLAAAKRFFLR